jgi:glycosyltransferase involved in cell wall biosynthesis
VNGDAATIAGRLAIQQRVLPAYRAAFFETLAGRCTGGLTVLAGRPRPGEAIASAEGLRRSEWVELHNRHWFSGPVYLCQQPGLFEWLSEHPPQALVLEANPRYLSNWRVQRWARRRGLPVIGWGLGSAGGTQLWNGLRRRFLSGFDALIAYSHTGAQAYRRLGAAAERTFVVVNAVASAPARPPSRPPGSRGPLHVLYVGRLQPRKRLEILIRACASISPPAELVIVGDGPDRGRLERKAEEGQAPVDFRGHLDGSALDDAYGWADVFALPGTGGLAVQQAMVHGLPVIVGEGDGTAGDLVRPGNGWRVEPGNEHALASALAQAQSDRARLVDMGAESFRIVAEEINLQVMVEQFVKIITSLTGAD